MTRESPLRSEIEHHRQPQSLADYIHSIWSLRPGVVAAPDLYLLSGFQLQDRVRLTTRLVLSTVVLEEPFLAAERVGQAARSLMNTIRGNCLPIAARTVSRLHDLGVPATVQKFRVSDGDNIAPHYATVAILPVTDWDARTSADSPYAPLVTETDTRAATVTRVIVDPSIDQFTEFSFSLHPEISRCTDSITPVEITTANDALAAAYQPITLSGDTQPAIL